MSELNFGGNNSESLVKNAFVNKVKIVEASEGQYGGLNCRYEKEITKKDGTTVTITGFVTIPVGVYKNGGVNLPTQDFLKAVNCNSQELVNSIMQGSPDWNGLSALATGKEIKVLEYATSNHNDKGYVKYKAWSGYKDFKNKTNVFDANTNDGDIYKAFEANPPKNYDPEAENIEVTEEASAVTEDIPF